MNPFLFGISHHPDLKISGSNHIKTMLHMSFKKNLGWIVKRDGRVHKFFFDPGTPGDFRTPPPHLKGTIIFFHTHCQEHIPKKCVSLTFH